MGCLLAGLTYQLSMYPLGMGVTSGGGVGSGCSLQNLGAKGWVGPGVYSVVQCSPAMHGLDPQH